MTRSESGSHPPLPPHSPEAERCVLGSMLRCAEAIDAARLVAGRDDFYADPHQKCFEAICQLHDRGGPVDAVLLCEELKRRGWLDGVGGWGYVGDLLDAAPTAVNAEYYAGVVRDKALLRELIRAGHELVRAGHAGDGPAGEVLEAAERRVLAINERRLALQDDERDAAALVGEVWDRADARCRSEGPAGLSTWLPSLDYLLAGLQPSELTIVAARPSVGKTTLGLHFALAASVREGRPALFVSLEQPAVDVAERAVCSLAGIDNQALKHGRLTAEEWERFRAGGERLRKAPLVVSDGSAQTVARIAARARRMLRRRGLALLLVDYLQLVEPESRRERREEQVAQVSRRLKNLARELRLPVVVMAQLNRESERRPDPRPRLSDLRESGAIEADADVAILLHRPDRDKPDLDVQVAKNRNGPTGELVLRHERSTGRVTDPAGGAFE